MTAPADASLVDSRQAWRRLLVTLALMTMGASGMYVVPVVLPAVQADFGVARADASLPYTLLMIGFGVGGLLMGRLADRFGVAVPLRLGAAGLGLGFVAAALSGQHLGLAVAHGVLIGCGQLGHVLAACGRHVAVVRARRGIAVAMCASGNYLGGAIWPPIVQHFVQAWAGARPTWAWPCSARGAAGAGAAHAPAARPRWPRSRPWPAAQPAGSLPFGLSPAPGAGAAVRGRRGLLRGHGHAAGAHRGLLHRPGLRRGARRRDAVADAGLRHRQPPGLGRHLRPHRRPAHAAAGLGAAGRGAAAVLAVRRAGAAVRDLGAVRPVPGRHRAQLRHHRARALSPPPRPARAWAP
jgi:MFS family permease